MSTVRFLRVTGHRSHQPAVLATVDGAFVKWTTAGWTCDCDTDADECQHVETVAELLDDRVLGEVG